MIKILVTEPEFFPEDFFKILQSLESSVVKIFDKDSLVKEIVDTDILIIRVGTTVDKELLDRAKQLKLIASATTGLNHIDLEYTKEKEIEVFNPVGYATESTAEHTFALILTLARKIPWAFQSVIVGEWERHKFSGVQLSGKVLGIIGLGRIGKQTAKYALAFGMKVLTYDPYITKETAADAGSEMVSFEELLSKSDFITVNVALTPETQDMINKNIFNKMRKSAMLINTSRGAVINENDLVEALEYGKISGASLDVFVAESLPVNSPLITYSKSHNNLLLTPHIGGSTDQSMRNACDCILAKLKEFLEKSGS